MLERTALPETSQPTPGLRLPRQVGMSSQLVQFALIVLGIALVTFIMYLYVLPNSQINAARTKIAEMQVQKAELQRQNAEVLKEIALASDLKTLEIRARQLGMGPVQSALYLRMPNSVATQDSASDPGGKSCRRSHCRSWYPGQAVAGRQHRTASQAATQRRGRLVRRHAQQAAGRLEGPTSWRNN